MTEDLKPREGWQPIETAPEAHATKILGWCLFPDGSAEIRICTRSRSALGKAGWFALGMRQDVTHWLPLPAPPEAAS